jgi:hypothetical protein
VDAVAKAATVCRELHHASAAKRAIDGGVPIDDTPVHTSPSPTSSAVSTPPSSDSRSSARGSNWFSAYEGFNEDINATFAANFSRLAIDQKWTKKEAKARRLEAFDEEFDTYFGKDMTKLAGWQQMCRDCAIEPVPPSITQCKKVCSRRACEQRASLSSCRLSPKCTSTSSTFWTIGETQSASLCFSSQPSRSSVTTACPS